MLSTQAPSGHQTTLPTVQSGWSACDLNCTMTELLGGLERVGVRVRGRFVT